MAKFRQIHVDFWQDSFVIELTPEEKYFYLYLMTNSKTSQCGIYELPKKIIEMDTGYNRETVDKLLKRFVDYGKIKYNEETKEVFLVNWIKYNAIKSPKVKSCIKKELEKVKTKEFIAEFLAMCKRCGYEMDTLSIPYPYGIDTVSIDYGEEKEKEKEKEKYHYPNDDADFREVSSFYQSNIGVMSPYVAECIADWCQTLSPPLVKEAIKRAVEHNVRKWSYIESILKSWHDQNVQTVEEVKAEDERRRTRKGKAHVVEPSPYKLLTPDKFLF
ncbi:DnaD domain protein [Geobacillus stearothermophilus]|nr:DnaD domain protein [Geobacillus stearothermophilus]